jgi:hypothetical protein
LFFRLSGNGGGMFALPIAGDFLSSYTKVEAGYNPLHTTETLIGYTAC